MFLCLQPFRPDYRFDAKLVYPHSRRIVFPYQRLYSFRVMKWNDEREKSALPLRDPNLDHRLEIHLMHLMEQHSKSSIADPRIRQRKEFQRGDHVVEITHSLWLPSVCTHSLDSKFQKQIVSSSESLAIHLPSNEMQIVKKQLIWPHQVHVHKPDITFETVRRRSSVALTKKKVRVWLKTNDEDRMTLRFHVTKWNFRFCIPYPNMLVSSREVHSFSRERNFAAKSRKPLPGLLFQISIWFFDDAEAISLCSPESVCRQVLVLPDSRFWRSCFLILSRFYEYREEDKLRWLFSHAYKEEYWNPLCALNPTLCESWIFVSSCFTDDMEKSRKNSTKGWISLLVLSFAQIHSRNIAMMEVSLERSFTILSL